MGKFPRSCLKILTCGGGGGYSSDKEDLARSQAKVSSDKCRWSFWKKSTRLNDMVISDPMLVVYDMETQDATTIKVDSPIHSALPEKPQVEFRPKETSPLSADIANSEIADAKIADRNTPVEGNIHNSVAVVIQSAVRGYLAQKELVKLKDIIKLQAAVRGHLVRRQAVGTLRCAQAIVKMQALVRLHHERPWIDKLTVREGKESLNTKWKKYSSVQIIVSNGFGRQILASRPKTKPIHMKCDPSKTDSTWIWLERWMAVTSSNVQVHNLNEANNLAEVLLISSNSKLDPNESRKLEHDEGHLVTNDYASLESELTASSPFKGLGSSENVDLVYSRLEDQNLGILDITREASDSFSVQQTSQLNVISQSIPDLAPINIETESNSPRHPANNNSPEIEGEASGFGLRRTCNRSFVVAQSTFEELGLTQRSRSMDRSIKSVNQDTVVLKSDRAQMQVDHLIRTRDHQFSENSISYGSRIQLASSECGTEISISSTLDSPDRSEAESGGFVLDIEALEKASHATNVNIDNRFDAVSSNLEASGSSSVLGNHQPQSHGEGNGSNASLMHSVDSVKVERQQLEPTTSDTQTHAEKSTDQLHGLESLPDGSGRSHATGLESHGTTSNHISTKAEQSEKENIASQKQKSQTAGLRSLSTLDNDSLGTSNGEHSVDTKIALRRRSFGGSKFDRAADQEPRISNSSLPSYMQATKSVKAKAQSSVSPKASPDVHDNDYPKKRHSLPVSNEKQVSSPNTERSTSQAHQSARGRSTRSPYNSAERRWRR